MKQETFTDIEYSYRKKKTKREEFLEIMEEIIPWDERNTGYFPTESLEPSGNRLFSRSALNEGDLFRGSQVCRNETLAVILLHSGRLLDL